MTQLLSISALFTQFKRAMPLAIARSAKAGGIAAWMDWAAAYCQIPCSEKSIPDLDQLAGLIAAEFRNAAISAEDVHDALAMARYPFDQAKGVIWPLSITRMVERNTQPQMQGITKGQALALAKNTREHLAWKAEIALRHGGDYKMFIERMVEPIQGFGDLGERRLEMMRAGEEIRLMARSNMVTVGRR